MQKLRVAVSVLQLRRDGDTNHHKFARGYILVQPCSKDKFEHTEGMVRLWPLFRAMEAHGTPPSSLRREGNSQSPKRVLPLPRAMMREMVFGQMGLLGIQLQIEVTRSPAASDIPIAFKMLHSHTCLTDPLLEQVENHKTGPKIQGQHFSVVNKNNHNPLPPLPHTDRHTGLYTACKPTPSENTSSRQNWFYASCRKKGNLWKSIKQQKYFHFLKSCCYTSFKTVSVEYTLWTLMDHTRIHHHRSCCTALLPQGQW